MILLFISEKSLILLFFPLKQNNMLFLFLDIALNLIGNSGKLCGTIRTLAGNRYFMKHLKMGLAGIVFSCIFILVPLGEKKSDLLKLLEKPDLTGTYRIGTFKGQL